MNNGSNRKALALGLALIAAGLSGVTRAESNFQTGTGTVDSHGAGRFPNHDPQNSVSPGWHRDALRQ